MQMQTKSIYAFAWICFTGGKPIPINDSNQIEFRLSLQFSYCYLLLIAINFTTEQQTGTTNNIFILLLAKYQLKQQHNTSNPTTVWNLLQLLASSRHATAVTQSFIVSDNTKGSVLFRMLLPMLSRERDNRQHVRAVPCTKANRMLWNMPNTWANRILNMLRTWAKPIPSVIPVSRMKRNQSIILLISWATRIH